MKVELTKKSKEFIAKYVEGSFKEKIDELQNTCGEKIESGDKSLKQVIAEFNDTLLERLKEFDNFKETKNVELGEFKLEFRKEVEKMGEYVYQAIKKNAKEYVEPRELVEKIKEAKDELAGLLQKALNDQNLSVAGLSDRIVGLDQNKFKELTNGRNTELHTHDTKQLLMEVQNMIQSGIENINFGGLNLSVGVSGQHLYDGITDIEFKGITVDRLSSNKVRVNVDSGLADDYLKLDCSNSPLTGNLEILPGTDYKGIDLYNANATIGSAEVNFIKTRAGIKPNASDFLGAIGGRMVDHNGDDFPMASIVFQASSVTTGSEKGQILFVTRSGATRATRMTLSGDGYLGIGRVPSGKVLDVTGAVRFQTDTETNPLLITRSGTDEQALKIVINDNDTVLQSIQDENEAGYGGFIFRCGNQASQVPYFRISDYTSGSDVNNFFLDIKNRNLALGATTSFGTSGVGVFAIKNGTEPSTSISDQIALYSVDLSAGNATLGIRTETAVVADTDETKFSHKLPIRINGSTYYMMLTQT